MGAPYELDKDEHLRRLRRIEGQVAGIGRMIHIDAYCIDILTQVSAVRAGLQKVALGLMNEHLRHCVRDAVASGDLEIESAKLAEAVEAVERMAKT